MSGQYLRLSNGFPRMTASPVPSEVYNELYSVVSPITSGTNITLPSSGTYTEKELKVLLNGQEITFSTVGSPPRTQITLDQDLVVGDTLKFEIGD